MASLFATFTIRRPLQASQLHQERNAQAVGADAQLTSHRRCRQLIATCSAFDASLILTLAVVLLRVSPASPIWVLIPMLAGRSLELVSLYYGQLTAVHSVLQLPLSLIMAVVLGTRYGACSKHTPGNCVPIAAAPIIVFIEVIFATHAIHCVRWYVGEVISTNAVYRPPANSGATPLQGGVVIRPAPRRGAPGSDLERAERGEHLVSSDAADKITPASYVHILQPGDTGVGNPIVLGLKLDIPPVEHDNHNTAEQYSAEVGNSTAPAAADASFSQLAAAEPHLAKTASEQGPSVQSEEHPEARASRTLASLANGPADASRRSLLGKGCCVNCMMPQPIDIREAKQAARDAEEAGEDFSEAECDGKAEGYCPDDAAAWQAADVQGALDVDFALDERPKDDKHTKSPIPPTESGPGSL